MIAFLAYFAGYSAGLFVVTIPLFVLAHRRSKRTTTKNFAIAALVVGALMAITSFTSDRLVQQCIDVGNTQCVDYGSTGFLLLMGIGYLLATSIRTWTLLGR